MQKRAIAVHDISCVGRCSLTVALPVLSAAGINTAVVPTALLSTHTGEFTGYTHLDLSDQLCPIAKHLSTLGLRFDAFYSGYLASGAQVDDVLAMMDLLCDPATHVFVDPAFADHGRLYSLVDDAMPAQMRKLCARANTIVPNLTEAAFLLCEPYPGDIANEALLCAYLKRLSAIGPTNVVITDVSFQPGQTGVALYSAATGATRFLFMQQYEGVFHGTGDVFASFLLSGLMNSLALDAAADLALSLTHKCIELAVQSGEPLRYGVPFELVLPELWAGVQRG